MNSIQVESLRQAAKEAILNNLYTIALFYADKLVTLSYGDPNDVLLLAQCYYLTQQYRRVIHLFQRYHLLPSFTQIDDLPVENIRNNESTDYPFSPYFRSLPNISLNETQRQTDNEKANIQLRTALLAAQSLSASLQWNECLIVLGENDNDFLSLLRKFLKSNTCETQIVAMSCVVRAKAYDALENRSLAVVWLREALKYEVTCFDAFNILIDGRMLKQSEEIIFLNSLNFNNEQTWLKKHYQMKISQYDHSIESLDTSIIPLMQCGLADNIDVLASRAHHHFIRREFQECHKMTKSIIEQDPFHEGILPTHVVTLTKLDLKSELFYCSHQLMDAYPHKSISWFAAGCYYILLRKFDAARRYFSKSTSIDHHFAPGWIGFAHSFALQDESDQAAQAYRTAARLFEGSHLPLLYIGMEYTRANNLSLAQHFLSQALSICSTDPLVHNELGIIAYYHENYDEATQCFKQALSMVSDKSMISWESTLYNLGHCYRKLKRYNEAITTYERAMIVSPHNSSVLCALGFTYHLLFQIDDAIQYYHQALASQPRNTFASDMLEHAFEDLIESENIINTTI